MVTRVQADKAADGGARSLGRGWAKISNRPLMVVMIIAALLVTLLAGVVASRAYTSNSAVSGQARDIQQNRGSDALAGAAQSQLQTTSSMTWQQFLDHNTYLPVGDDTGLASSAYGRLQRQLRTTDERDYGPLATRSADFDTFYTPCPPFESMCNR